MCRPDGRHVLNNQGTDDYVLTNIVHQSPETSYVLHFLFPAYIPVLRPLLLLLQFLLCYLLNYYRKHKSLLQEFLSSSPLLLCGLFFPRYNMVCKYVIICTLII